MDKKFFHRGFTLIELSIVLVIIGLVIGGILVGQSLIRSAEIKSIFSDVEKLKTAVYSFKSKYAQLPGDINYASQMWGSASDCRLEQTTSATCNGNNDGLIRHNSSPTITSGYEVFLLWKHLANAQMISGNYTGITDGSTYYSVTSNNSPVGRIKNSLFHVFYAGAVTAVNGWGFDGQYGNLMEFGLYRANNRAYREVVTSSEAKMVDSKFDDGKPGTGTIRVRKDNVSCSTLADGVTPPTSSDFEVAMYRSSSATNTTNYCVFIFPNVF